MVRKIMWCVVVCLGLQSMLGAKTEQESVRTFTRAEREAAVHALAELLPRVFIDQQTIDDAHALVQRDIDPAMQEKLMNLQERAESLRRQRAALLAIEGMSEQHQAVQALDRELELLGKEMDDLIYSDGTLNWKSWFSYAVGFAAAYGFGKSKVPGENLSIRRALIAFFVVSGLVEYALRGRRALLAGYSAKLLQKIGGVLGSFGIKVFGEGGLADKMQASIERLTRPFINLLDKHIGGDREVAVVVCALAVSLSIAHWGTRSTKS